MQISLKAARVNANMTQEDVARKLRKGKQTIVNWENGRTVMKVNDFTRLCDLYGLEPRDIFLPTQST